MSEYFTSLTAVDRDALLDACKEGVREGKLKLLEVGVFGGATARGIKDFCDQNGIALDYWGVDNGAHPGFNGSFQPNIPFPGAKFIKGDSVEVTHQLPNDFNVIFLDGCHCFNHVILETIHYSKKVVSGGFLIHHDTSPFAQHKYRDPHGPDTLLFYNSVELALEELAWSWLGWWEQREGIFDREAKFGGVRVTKKL